MTERPSAHDPADAASADPASEGARPGADPARRRAERRQAIALAATLLAVGALAWSFQLREPLAVDARPLDALPRDVAGWHAQDVPLEDTVEAILRADHNLQRVYQHPVGSRVGVYVGYYGTERGGRPEHTPWVCYPNAGWAIEAHRTLVVDPERGLRVNEFQVEKDGERALVHFWYRSFRSTGLLGGVDQVWDRFLGRLRHDRSDGALVRLSSALGGEDVAVVRSRLMGFGEKLDLLLDEHWPDEHPEPSQG
jgi:EpsI family protein